MSKPSAARSPVPRFGSASWASSDTARAPAASAAAGVPHSVRGAVAHEAAVPAGKSPAAQPPASAPVASNLRPGTAARLGMEYATAPSPPLAAGSCSGAMGRPAAKNWCATVDVPNAGAVSPGATASASVTMSKPRLWAAALIRTASVCGPVKSPR